MEQGRKTGLEAPPVKGSWFGGAKKGKTLSGAPGEDFAKGSQGITQLPSKLERYGMARERAIENFAYLDEITTSDSFERQRRVLERLNHCGNYLVYHNYWQIDEVRLVQASFCMTHLLCPLCAIRRAAKQTGKAVVKLEALFEEKPTLQPYMLTLTVKNGPDLAERFEHLRDSWKKLNFSRKRAQQGKGSSLWGFMLGGLFSFEFTHSEKGWHPHVHAIVLCDPADMPADTTVMTGRQKQNTQLSKAWKKITRDSYIVDFRPIEGVKGVCEVMKYALKFSSLTPEQNIHAWETLSNRRLVGAFGNLWGVKLDVDDLTDDPLVDLPYIEYFYVYRYKAGYSLARSKAVDNLPIAA